MVRTDRRTDSSLAAGKLRLRFVVFRYSHHSPHSGYSRLAEYVSAQHGAQVIRVAKPLPKAIFRDRIMWRVAGGVLGYGRAALAAELNVAWRILRECKCVYHFLYGETTYHYAGLLNNIRGNRVLATFHLPPAGIQQSVRVDWHLRQLSGAVCLGRNQQEYLSSVLGPERVFFVPLGVDTDYYSPPSFDTRDPDLCLFVGENYRDFPTLRGVVELVAYRRPKTRFVAVTPPRNAALIGNHPNLRLVSDVSESDFRALYRAAALMVMPLHDAVANNALLEGMASGLPMVISNVGAVTDYVTSQQAVLSPPGDARSMADAILALLDEPRERKRMAIALREQALTFAWPRVAAQMVRLYESLC